MHNANECELKVGDIVFYEEKPFYVIISTDQGIGVKSNNYELAVPISQRKHLTKINITGALRVDKSFLESALWKRNIDYAQAVKSTVKLEKYTNFINEGKEATLDRIIIDRNQRGGLSQSAQDLVHDSDFPLVRVEFDVSSLLLTPLEYIRPALTQVETQPECTCPSHVLLWGHNKGCYLYKEYSR